MPSKTISHSRPIGEKKENIILAVVCAAQFILILDLAVVNVALPSIQTSLHFSSQMLQWLISAYSIAFGGFLMLGGRLADRLGRTKTFLFGMTLFTLSSLLGGLSQTQNLLILSRGLQGFAAAIVSPAALSMLTSTFREHHSRLRALGFWSAAAAAGTSAGVVLGGLLTQFFGWRFILLINVPLGLIVLAFASVFPRAAVHKKTPLDIAGSLALTLTIISFVVALSEATSSHVDPLRVMLPAIFAVCSLSVFVALENASNTPFFSPRLLKSRGVIAGNIVAITMSIVSVALAFFITLYMQQILGYSPFLTGLAWLPQTLLVLAFSPLAARFISRFGSATGMAVGMTLFALAAVLFTQIQPHSQYVLTLLPPMLIVSVANALAYVGIISTATVSASENEQGVASALINTSQQLGTAVGLAVLVNLAAAVTATSLASMSYAILAGYHTAFVAAGFISCLGALVAIIVPEKDTVGQTVAKIRLVIEDSLD